jgi:hypothetical protein
MKWIKESFPLLHKRSIRSLLLIGAFLLSLVSLQGQQNVATFQLDALSANLFRVSMITDTSFAAPNNTVNSMQIVLRARTGNFQVSNLTNLINQGQANEVQFAQNSRNNAPADNPNYDYISFTLTSLATPEIPFVKGDTVHLFTFQNGGTCTQDSLSIVTENDPFYAPNSIGANINNQLTVLGYPLPNTPIGINATKVPDCITNHLVEYKLEKRPNGTFQFSIIPKTTYTGSNRAVPNMQVTIRVKSEGFQVGNIVNLRNPGAANEVQFSTTSRYNQPVENPNYDYISFALLSTGTEEIPFQTDQEVPLFTFDNIGLCTEDTVSLITQSDPFYPPNISNSNSGQQMSIAGYGTGDIPIRTNGFGALDCTKECFMGCNDNVQVSLGVNCVAEVKPEMVATALHLTCPNGPKSVEIMENGLVIPTSPFLNESHIGKTLQVRVIDSLTTNSCWGSIIVKDKTPPTINCKSDTLQCGIQDFSPNNPLLGYPLVTDNCSDTLHNLTFLDRIVNNGCDTNFSGLVERTWTATDSNGMVGTCVQNIYFERMPLDSVVFPPNRDGVESPIVDCANGATHPSNTGAPTMGGHPLYPNPISFCQINAGYRDDSVSFCTGNNQIIRTWTVVDACTGLFRTDIQIISVQDTTPPVLNCLDTIQAVVDDGICSSTVTFPPITATDGCSGARVRIETPFGIVNGNGGTLQWVPQGVHQVVYVGIDSCNNIARCTTVLNVVDRTIPIATCDFINDVSLRPDGTVVVEANVFDDGSRDDCSGNQLTLAVKKVGDTLDFADFVTFYCHEAGDTINVRLRVTDLNGNSDECIAAIAISNNTAPIISCPRDTTIQCTDNYTSLSVFGVPTITDNCGGMTSFTETDSFELNNCGMGRIIRTFTVSHGGTPITCEQIITVENNTSFDSNGIVWPANYSALACTNPSLHPDSLPSGFNVPMFDSAGLCKRILRYYNDAVLDDVTDPIGCYKILRTWSVIDWCTFNPNDTAAGGYWSHVQQIDLVNTTRPTFTICPTDFEVPITDNSCSANVTLMALATDDCTPDSLITYSFNIDLYDDGSVDTSSNTNNASGIYPTGVHRIEFRARDDCGNISSCIFRFTVADRTRPNAICNSDTINIVNVGDELGATVDARQLALNSTDNCTDFANLTITAVPPSFTCPQLGVNQVTVTVTDSAGNSNTCVANVRVNDISNICPINRTAVNISGIITNEMGEKMEEVHVSINHPDVKPSMTNIKGEFKLEDVPVGNDYTVLPNRDFDILNGVSTFDLVLLNRHILNIENITSPYKLIAADVNRSGNISAFDIVLLRKLILRLTDSFPNNNAWRFVRTDFNFKKPKESHKNYFPEVYNINDLPKEDMWLEGFVAIKIGDVNGSANVKGSFVEGESRSPVSTLKLKVEEQLLKAGTLVEVPITANNFQKILGFQFAMNFDINALELVKLIPNAEAKVKDGNFGLDFIKRGIITCSWNQAQLQDQQKDNQELFTLQFKIKENLKLSEVLSISPEFMKMEAYEKIEASEVDLMDVGLLFESNNQPSSDFKLYQNKPNPFKTNTLIGFELKKAENIQFKIMDITGKTVKQINYEGQLGRNELLINNKDLKGKGVYYYQIATTEGIKTKKMLVIE